MTPPADDDRQSLIVDTLVDAFADLMTADSDAFRVKFRKMAADPWAFFRGSACVFYTDLAAAGDDPWVDERSGRVWIQGDLHAENFGTYMDGAGHLVFDVNDFDEAYLGPWTWDLRRFVASLGLLCWQKALPDEAIGAWCRRTCVPTWARCTSSSRATATTSGRCGSTPPPARCAPRCRRRSSRRGSTCWTG